MLEKLRLSKLGRTVLFVSLIALTPELAVRAAETSKDSVLTGTLSILYGDGLSGSGVDTVALRGLVDGDGRWIPLRVETARTTLDVGFSQLVGKRVRVTGSWSEGEAEASGERSLIVATIEPLEESEGLLPGTEVPIGAKPFASILCRFSDINYIPHPLSYYVGLMGNGSPFTRPQHMDKYWREISYDAVNLQGSQVFGWYDLPHPLSYYWPPTEPYPNLWEVLADCAAAADAEVYFPSYFGINLFLNGGIGNWGVRWQLTLDGQPKTYGVTWLESNSHKLNYLAHEMGHAFGVAHSQCGEWEKSGTCHVEDPVYGCIPVHELGAYKDHFHGWIPASRIHTPSNFNSRAIRLERLALPVSTAGYLLVKVPINGSTTHYYTLETRKFAGYDANNIPGEAVIIQDVDTTRPEPAHTVIANGGSCSSEGAMWRVGERFVDSANGLYFEVLSGDATSFQVTVGHCCSGPACSVSDVPCPPSIILEPTDIESAGASELP